MKNFTTILGEHILSKKKSVLFFLLFSPLFAYSQTTYTSGSGSWDCPAGVYSVLVECWGAGGGGGNSDNTTTNGGTGGGGGGYSNRVISVTPGVTYYYSVGTGGTGAPANSTTIATTGGNTWFNNSNSQPASSLSTNVLAYGGARGNNNSLTAGGSGGTTGFGDVTKVGGNGGAGGSAGGSGGGSSAGTAANGVAGTQAYSGGTAYDAAGGIAPAGGGNGGRGGAGYNNTTPFYGGNGVAPGGGGGGSDDQVAYAGGAGANGQIIITISNYYSKSTGNLEILSNWGTNTDGTGNAPTSFTSNYQTFNIRNNTTPTIGANWTISGTGSSVIVGDGSNACTFTVPSGFTYSSTATTISANGTLKNQNASVTSLGTATVSGTYQHDCNGGTIPAATWSSGATLNVTGITSTACTGLNQSFHHVTWNCASQTVDVNLNASPTWGGDLTVSSTGAGSNKLSVSSGAGSYTLTVSGNVSISGGTLTLTTGASSGGGLLSVSGNMSVSGTGKFYCQSANWGGTLTVTGNLTTSGSATFMGADVNYNSNSTWNLYGNIDVATGTVGARSGSTNNGYTTINLYGSNKTFKLPTSSMVYNQNAYWNINIKNGAIITLSSDLYSGLTTTVSTGGTLIMGTYVIQNMTSNSFVTQSGSILKTANTLGIVSTGASGSVQTGTRTLNGGATYEYNGASAQVTGTGLPTSISGTLKINNSSGVALTQATAITGTLDLTSGLLTTTTSLYILIDNGGTVSNYSASSYVYGPCRRYLTNTSNHFFPIGDATNYKPFELNAVSCTTGALVQVSTASTGASTYDYTLSTIAARNWFLDYVSGTLTSATVRITESGLIASSIIGKSSAQSGTYSNAGGTSITTSVTSNGAVTITSADMYFAIGTVCSAYSGTVTVGASGNTFTSLTQAITYITYCGFTGNLIVELDTDYDGTSTNETFPITFTSAIGSTSLKKITIRPISGNNSEVITSSSATGTILLNGVSYIYFNGSPGGGNTMNNTNNFSIINTHASTGYAIRFTGDATYNKIEYCNVKSNMLTNLSGVITFDTPSTATGNSNNQINYCEVTKASTTPTNCIFSSGAASKLNQNNIINGCYIYDFFHTNNVTHSGVFIYNYNTDWSITNNRFYQTAARDLGSSSASHRIININYDAGSAGNNFTITGNTIGGSQSDNTGTYDFTGEGNGPSAGNFSAIYLKAGTTSASTVSNNTIKNLALKAIDAKIDVAGYEGGFNGIAVLAGKVNIGSSGNGNTIGSTSSANSITYYSAVSNIPFYGIYINSASDVTVAYNNIGGFSTSATSGDAVAYRLAGIYNYSTGGTISITNNTIGSTTIANSMVCGKTTSNQVETFYGIYSSSTGVATINSNTIQNATVYGVSVASALYPIYNSSSANNSSISTNTISTLSNASSGTTGISTMIYNSANSLSISNNTISSISVINGNFKGIYSTSTGAVTISGNSIGGVSTANVARAYTAYGIQTAGTLGAFTISTNTIGSTTVANSIQLGGSSTAANICSFYGINNAATGIATITSNTLQNVSVYGTVASVLYPIYNTAGASTSTISSNTISTLSNTSNGTDGVNTMIYNSAAAEISISSNAISAITINNGIFKGIHDNVAPTGLHTISSNIIGGTSANSIANACALTYSVATPATNTSVGIHLPLGIGTGGSYAINSNTIQNITNSGAAITALTGILCESTGPYPMSGNTIKYLKNSNTGSFAGLIYGIRFDAAVSSSTIQKNRITNCSSSQTGSPEIYGIYNWSTGTLLIYNNFISCNNEGGTNSVTIYGIYQSLAATLTVHYNTIKIFGTPSSGTSSSYCFYYNGGTADKILGFKNNLLFNSRTNTGSASGKHFVYRLNTPTAMTAGVCDYNYFYNPTDANFANVSNADVTKANFIVATQGYGGANSNGSNAASAPITINDDGSLSTGDLSIVTRGTNLNATTGCESDIYNVARNASGGYRGCYESPCLIVTTNPAAATICVGSTYSPSIVVTNATLNTTIFTYQMQFSTSVAGSYSNVSDGTPANATYTNGLAYSGNVSTNNNATHSSSVVGGIVVGSANYYRYLISSSAGCSIYSSSAQMTIKAPMTTTPSSGDYIWKGANSNWSTLSNWLIYSGSSYSVASVLPSFSNRTIISATNGCASVQPVLDIDNSSVGSLILETSSSLGNSSYNLNVNGGFTNDGTFTASTGTITFKGSGTISGNSVTTFNNVTLDGSSISVDLGDNISITGTLTLTSGNLNLSNYNLTLTGSSSGGNSSSYINTSGTGALVKSVTTSGVTYTFPIGQSAYSPFTLNFTSGLSSNSTITSYTKPDKIPGLNSANTYYLNRYWSIEQNNIDLTTLNYTVVLNYDQADITNTDLISPGTESTLKPVKKSSGTWYKPTGSSFTDGTFQGTSSIDVISNTLTWTGLTTFSTLSGVGSNGGGGVVALPISLISFTGKTVGADNELKWVTASEKNNNYFTIEKTTDGTIFDILGVVNGAGTSNAILDYQFTDYNVSSTLNYYRLKQTDYDGVFKYTDLISIDNRSSKVEKQIATITNILGQEINENYRGLIIIVYTDGSSEKVIR